MNVNISPDAPKTLAPFFISYVQEARSCTPSPTHLGVFHAFENGAQTLGLKPEHIALGLSYWLTIGPHVKPREDESSGLLAAALLSAVEIHQAQSTMSWTRAQQAFSLEPGDFDLFDACVTRLLKQVSHTSSKDVLAQLDAFRTWEAHHMAVLAEQRFIEFWKTSPDPGVVQHIEVADFGMILELIEVDEAAAQHLPYISTPSLICLASSDRRDEPLATIPWFGPMNEAQRRDALLATLIVASHKPQGVQPARPLIVFVPTQQDVDALIGVPELEGMAFSTHEALAAHLANLNAMSSSRRARRPKTRAPRRMRRRLRKK